jgi:hypothetical protein
MPQAGARRQPAPLACRPLPRSSLRPGPALAKVAQSAESGNRSGSEAPALGAGSAAEKPTRRTMQGKLDSEI